MSTTRAATAGRPRSLIARLNVEWHRPALLVFAAIVLAHWAEHVVQAYQIWVLHISKPKALGLLGSVWPWLISSEWLHYGFAVVMFVGLAVLLPGFTGRARTFWIIALGIQTWHLFEHQILLIQAATHHYWFGAKVQTSVLQSVWPMDRPEIHLVYNALVTIPMVVAMWFHLYPPIHERGRPTACACDRTARTAA